MALSPADGTPLRLLLGLLDDGCQLLASLLCLLVDHESVEEVSVAGLHQLGRLLQLRQVLLLQGEKKEYKNGDGMSVGDWLLVGRRLAVGGATHIFPGVSQLLWTRSPDKDDEGLQAAGP